MSEFECPASPTSVMQGLDGHERISFSDVSLGNEIGHGATSNAYLSEYVNSEGLRVAAVTKILKHNAKMLSIFQAEKTAMSIVRSPYVVKILGADPHTARLLLEYCPNGEFFHAVSKLGSLREDIAKFYLRQLWSAVAACHSAGVAHRDIKLENILIDENWNLRLADFGFATTGFLVEAFDVCGTPGHQAPEILKLGGHSPCAVDVWSAGISSFIIVVGVPPFLDVKKDCWYYACARDQRWDAFWKQHEKFRSGPPLSAEVKLFLQRALRPDARDRPTAAQMLRDDFLSEEESEVNAQEFMEEAFFGSE